MRTYYDLIPSQTNIYMLVKFSFHKEIVQIPASFSIEKDIDFPLIVSYNTIRVFLCWVVLTMSVHGVPVCNIRYCHRPPASWILAGFALLARDGVLKLGQVVRSEQFLKQDVYAHNSIVEAEIEGERIVFDYENGYQSFLRPELFDTQIGSVRAYFKCNYDPSRFEGMKNKDKVHPFIAGMYTGTCAGNPYDRVGLLDNGLSVKGLREYLSNLRHRAEYLKQYDYTLAECSSSFPS